MSVITAYKCDTTGKLFEDKTKYQKHIRKIAADRRLQCKIDAAHRAEEQWWHDNFWNRVKSLEQLKFAILHHRDVFAQRGVKNYWGGSTKSKLKPTPLVEFKTFRLNWNEHVSNSHDAPVGGVTCWSSHDAKDGRPTGYPGWTGYIDYVVQSHKNQLHSYPGSSDMWSGTRIHTGTGGGGGYKNQETNHLQSFAYDFRLFASDWPAMALEYEKARAWMILTEDHSNINDVVNRWNPAEKYLD